MLGLTGPPALLFAATHPARTSALVVLDPSARFRGDDAYPGLDSGEIDRTVATIEGQWGTGVLGRLYGWGGDERAPRLVREDRASDAHAARGGWGLPMGVRHRLAVGAPQHFGTDAGRGATTARRPDAEPEPVCRGAHHRREIR